MHYQSVVTTVTFACVAAMFALPSHPAVAVSPDEHCSSLALDNDGQVVFGCNYDSHIDDDGIILINKRGVVKTSYQPGTTGRLAEWTSRYASITFTLLGNQFPWAGMNERGLSMSTMSLTETECPQPDERPLLESGFWLQYMLDTCETVAEALAIDAEVRIQTVDHYLVADRHGEVAVIEFLDGHLAATTGPDLCISALTNNLYEESCQLWESLRRTGSCSHGNNSVERFCLAAERVHDFQTGSAAHTVDYAFETLNQVRGQIWGGDTRWSIVFDTLNLRAFFRTDRNPEIRWAELGAFDLRCGHAPQMLDINTDHEGDVSEFFTDLDLEVGRSLIEGYLDRWNITFDPEQITTLLNLFENYPCRQTCRASGRRVAPTR